ncbi:MAG: hypothetical protein ACXV8Q_05695 [Methylobacter sp.]
MHKRLFATRSLRLVCIALILALNGCNPEKQWELQTTTGHLPNLRSA